MREQVEGAVKQGVLNSMSVAEQRLVADASREAMADLDEEELIKRDASSRAAGARRQAKRDSPESVARTS